MIRTAIKIKLHVLDSHIASGLTVDLQTSIQGQNIVLEPYFFQMYKDAYNIVLLKLHCKKHITIKSPML